MLRISPRILSITYIEKRFTFLYVFRTLVYNNISSNKLQAFFAKIITIFYLQLFEGVFCFLFLNKDSYVLYGCSVIVLTNLNSGGRTTCMNNLIITDVNCHMIDRS